MVPIFEPTDLLKSESGTSSNGVVPPTDESHELRQRQHGEVSRIHGKHALLEEKTCMMPASLPEDVDPKSYKQVHALFRAKK